MKYLLFLTIFSSCAFAAYTQNIVPNPTFANYVACPGGLNGITDNKCAFWDSPTTGTSDYFHQCATTNVGIPANIVGYQASASGSYAGILTYKKDAPSYREYLTANLGIMEAGQTYHVTLYISLADTSTYATDGLGVFFYRHFLFNTNSSGTIPCTPQIDYSGSGVVADKENWTKLSTTFVADSAYLYIIIGNFKDDATVDTTSTGSVAGPFLDGAYYYIDSVSVEKDQAASLPAIASNPIATVFPNPVNESVTFKLNGLGLQTWNLQILNFQGAQVYNAQLHEQETTLKRSHLNLTPGLYFYHIQAEGQLLTGKFMVQ